MKGNSVATIPDYNMRIDVYHHLVDDQAVSSKMDEIIERLKAIQAQGEVMANELQTLEQQVRANDDAVQSATLLLNKLHQMLVDAQNDPARLQAVIAQLGQQKDALAQAVTANTPAEPA